jgi:hypothetical protein
MRATPMGEHVDALGTLGFVRITGPFARIQDAWAAARALIDAASADDGPLAVIGRRAGWERDLPASW